MKKSKFVKTTIAYLQRTSFPGFKKHSIYEVGSFFYRSLQREGIQLRGSSMAFSFFLAIFPSLLFLLTLISYLPIKGLKEEALSQMEYLFPAETFAEVKSTVLDVLMNQHEGLLSISVLMFLYFASNGVLSMISSFNKRLKEPEKGFFMKNRLKSVAITLFIAIQTTIGISLIVYAEILLDWINSQVGNGSSIMPYVIILSKFILLFVLADATISALYHFCTNKKTHYKLFSIGSVLSTILCLLTTYLFSFYVDNFGSYNKIYGSLGAIMALMMLIYFNSMSMLIGYELNSSIVDAEENSILQ